MTDDVEPRARPKRKKKEAPETTEVAPPAAADRPRKALTAGGTLLPLGLALVGIGPSDVGMGITLLSLLVLIYGVHSFGRLGPA